MSDNPKPTARITFFPVSASIWRRQVNQRVFYTTQFEKSYKDDAGKWKSTTTFDPSDLLLLAKAADHAHTEINRLRTEDRQAQKSDEEEA